MACVDELVRQARDRHISAAARQAAFSRLVERFRAAAMGWALEAAGDFHIAEDAVQEAFLSAYLELDGLREAAAFGGWLKTVVRRKALRLARQRGDLAEDWDREEDVGAEAAARQAWVRQGMATLKPAERLPLALFYLGGYSIHQLAALLEISPAAAKKRLQRARAGLAARMDAMTEEELEGLRDRQQARFADDLRQMLEAVEPRELFRARDAAALEELVPVVQAVKDWEGRLGNMDAEQIRQRTADLRQAVAEALGQGRGAEEVLAECLPAAFGAAAVCWKRAGEEIDDAALAVGVALHRGQVAVGQGEACGGAVLAALYLNALAGTGVELLTPDALAAGEWTARLQGPARALGLDVACGTDGGAADIVCAASADRVFAHLKDGLADQKAGTAHFAVLYGIEQLLVEGFKTPLEVSGPVAEGLEPRFFSEGMDVVQALIERQKGEGGYYETQGYNLELTERGLAWLQETLPQAEGQGPGRLAAIRQLARGRLLYERGRDYVVEEGRVFVADTSGLALKGRRFSDGLHQALEALEGVEVRPLRQVLARTTYHEFLRTYPKLAGIALPA